MPDPSSDPLPIVYWRPGCGFCSALLSGLERAGLGFEGRNIWDDPEDAAFVRSVARGNETVPTVRIGEVALINPTARDVLRTVASETPQHLPDDLDPTDLEPRGPGRLLGRLLGR